MIFKNKSVFYTALMLLLGFAGLGFIGMIVMLTFGTIASTSGYILAIEAVYIIVSLYILIWISIRYFFSDSYFKITHSGVEISFVDFFCKVKNFTLKWEEIYSIEERVVRRIYKLVIVPQNKKAIKIPPELYLNYFRVDQIEKSLSDKPIKLTRNPITKFYLILGDIAVIIVTLIFVAMFVSILYQQL